jgi:BolA family transcriptional regulator, general stress-responsive regulator
MLSRTERITQALQAALTPSFLKVLDESGGHAGHGNYTGGEQSHLAIIIESEALKGLSRVAAHQKIYGLLQPEFDGGLHALRIEVR